MADQKFALVLNIRIEQRDEYGRYVGSQLQIQQELTVKASSFLEIASIIGRFHELAQAVGQEQVDALSVNPPVEASTTP